MNAQPPLSQPPRPLAAALTGQSRRIEASRWLSGHDLTLPIIRAEIKQLQHRMALIRSARHGSAGLTDTARTQLRRARALRQILRRLEA